MPPIISRFEARRILASFATLSVVFLGGSSIAGCQNETAAQVGPQISAGVNGNSPDQTPAVDPAPTPAATTLVTPPPVGATSIPAPRPVPAPSTGKAPAPGVAVAPPPSASSAHVSGSCDADYYRNSDGNCVHRPQQAATAPSGATAQCKDGSYSFSQHRQGTCSGHHGVAQWL
jgi:hypothetical protein